MKATEADWAEAKRRCRLSAEEVRMARELGFKPKGLIKNIPSPPQKWKAPVGVWVRDLYERKIGSRAPAPPPQPRPNVVEIRNPKHPWPDNPDIPAIVVDDTELVRDDYCSFEPPSEDEIEQTNTHILARQRLFRWAAQAVAISLSGLPEITRVAAFGSASKPLIRHVPRFREYRRYRIEVLHECRDLDLAVWMKSFDRLAVLQQALKAGLSSVRDTPYGGVAHHQVDTFLFDADTGLYRGQLCIFGQCPKPAKRECLVPGCGAKPFLRRFEGFQWRPERFEAEPKVLLFDRAHNLLVAPPRIEAKPVIWKGPVDGESSPYDDDKEDREIDELPF